MNRKQIKRGDMFYANLNPTIGSEQGDVRPVLVVQNNAGNAHSPTVVVVPITRNLNKTSLLTHVVLLKESGLEHDSLALVEQIRTIDRSRMTGYIGRIGGKEQAAIDTALLVCVGIENRRASKGEMMVLTLCFRCEGDFRDSGYVLVKKGWQEIKEDCDFCKVRQGLTFGVFGMP
ncbi:MAG: type II toxin-antitoxin system PemK/MazF family toxin [Oscillospiraceae bacterium]|nr:type II toxin-antitoxin system PemK/MazF family toxin [Oscillospiraceae bacterium]